MEPLQRTKSVGEILGALLLACSVQASAADPDCAGPDQFPTASALVKLANAGLVDRAAINPSMTRVVRLTSARIADNRFRQIHEVTFVERSGRETRVLIDNVVSPDECSETGVQVFVISRVLPE